MDKNTKQRKQMIKEMKNSYRGKLYGVPIFSINSVVPKRKPAKELNFLQAFIILVITLVLFTVIFPLIQRAVDIEALNNCELRGDCSEVIRDINK